MASKTNDAPDNRPRVVILRGHQANPWELRPWQEASVAERFDVVYARTRRGWFDTTHVQLPSRRVWTLRDLLPPGRVGDTAVRLPGDRYLGLRRALADADIVHAQELGYWYSMQAAALRARMGFKLLLTVWETIPFLEAYRNVRTRAYRARTLRETDLFLATTERAATALLLEGAPRERIRLCPPGVPVRPASGPVDRPGETTPLIISPARLVWEKGHQDVLRAVALLRRDDSPGPPLDVQLMIVGKGPEERRLRSYAAELGIADAIEFRGFVPHDEMTALYARADCLVLASLAIWFWEEQFGMVLAEAMATGTPIIASASGAIPEVVGGKAALFAPGDWIGLAARLQEVLATRHEDPPREQRFAVEASAQALASAYDEALGRQDESAAPR